MAKEKPAPKINTNEMGIFPCSCEHEYQDKKLGKGKRYFNPNNKGYRCTVCGKSK